MGELTREFGVCKDLFGNFLEQIEKAHIKKRIKATTQYIIVDM
jgi:hypothetical protein